MARKQQITLFFKDKIENVQDDTKTTNAKTQK